MSFTSFTPFPEDLDKSVVNSIRASLGVAGLLAFIAGLLILIWPGHVASVIAIIIAIYALAAGLVNLGIGIFSRELGVGPRIGYLLLGALFVLAGIVIIANPAVFVTGLALFLGILIGVLWIVDGVVSFVMLPDSGSKAWTAVYAVISLLAGILMLSSPLWGAEFLWLVVGLSAVILGLIGIVRGFQFGRGYLI
jgi:uncharacterized membrane protein HdeD (DUF308 family)